MVVLIIRIIILVAVLVGLYFIIKKLLTPSDYITCQRCEGKGFWYDARGKEICDWCKGDGKLPRAV